MYLILYVVTIIAGIVCIAIASTWPGRPARLIFILFVACSFIIPSCLSLATVWLYSGRNYWAPRSVWAELASYTHPVFAFISILLMIVYVILRRGDLGGKAPAPTQALFGPSWNTDLDARQLAAISSKRNLAFLIDYAPMLLSSVGLVYWLGFVGLNQNFKNSPIVETVAPIGVAILVMLALFYIVLKDAFGGRSIGKKFFNCRVVSKRTGQPIGVNESITRNLILAIPFGPTVELLASMFRKDKRRFGDLMSESQVVAGPPQFVDGVPVADKVEDSPAKHALDD